jgi:hypothetical protein
MGVDAVTFDPPVWAMMERKQFWESHRLMVDHDYWHLEKLTNLDQIGRSYGSRFRAFQSSGLAPPLLRCARWPSLRTSAIYL